MTRSNHSLFQELEFWKSTALENPEVSEDAYKECCQDVQRMNYEMDPDNAGVIHG